jgi:hypothetical protein
MPSGSRPRRGRDSGEYGIGGGPGWLHGENVTVTNSNIGVDFTYGHVRVDGLVVQHNAVYGVFTRAILRSVLTGNGIDLSTVAATGRHELRPSERRTDHRGARLSAPGGMLLD